VTKKKARAVAKSKSTPIGVKPAGQRIVPAGYKMLASAGGAARALQDELDARSRAAAREREPAAAQLVIVDKKGNVVQTWSGDINQAAEIRKNLPKGLRVKEE